MPTAFFDSHFHLESPDCAPTVLQEARTAGVTGGVLAGTGREDSFRYAQIAAQTPGFYATAGVHPHEAETHGTSTDWIIPLLDLPAVVAVGEIGLDYYYDHSPRERQRATFQALLEVAVQRQTPVVIHCRDAYDDCLDVLRPFGNTLPPLLVHSYTGSVEWAVKAMELDAYFSFNGIVTFKNGQNVRDVLAVLPMSRVLLETDAPYLAPAPHRGKRNRPAYVAHIAERIAEERGLPLEDVAHQTTANACAFFGLDAAQTADTVNDTQ